MQKGPPGLNCRVKIQYDDYLRDPWKLQRCDCVLDCASTHRSWDQLWPNIWLSCSL